MRRPAVSAAVLSSVVLSLAATVVSPVPAGAVATTITSLRLAAVTSTSFTVTVASLGSGWNYRVYASTTKSNVYYTNLSRALHSSYSSTPRMTLGGLPANGAVYWYRVQAVKGASHRTGAIYSVGLLPATPTGLTAVTATSHGTSLHWSSGRATSFRIQQANDPAFTTGLKTYTMAGPGHQFTPYGLRAGTRYYFRIRALNPGAGSPYTAAISTVAASGEQRVRVLTYNVTEAYALSDPGGTISPWSQRRAGVAALIEQSKADVVAVQEAAAWIGNQHPSCPNVPPREVDSVVSALGGSYKLATTEYPPCHVVRTDHLCHPMTSTETWVRAANYILYNPTTYSALGGWTFNVGDGHLAAYQLMRNRTTGAKFLFVAPHLAVNSGLTGDQMRETETQSLIKQATSCAATQGNVPVVYAGDFNSHAKHALDGPAVAMRAARVADALQVGQVVTNSRYNSGNQYFRTPPATGDSIDHVYASPGVAVLGWREMLNLSSGRFVGVIPSDHNPVVSDLTYPY